MKRSIIIIFLFAHINFVGAQEIENHYFQDIKKEIKIPVEEVPNVLKLYKTGNTIVAVTSNGVFRYQQEGWSGSNSDMEISLSIIDSKGNIWLAKGNTISDESRNFQIGLPPYAQYDTIKCLLWENGDKLLVGTNQRLLSYDDAWREVTPLSGRNIISITEDAQSHLWVATDDGLYTEKLGKWVNMDEVLMAQGLKRKYFSLATIHGGKDIVFGGTSVVGCIAGDGNHWLFNGYDGLPYGPVTTIRAHESTLWLGTEKGLIKKDSTWHFYHGKRWLPDNKINDILVVDPQTVWVATPKGISEIKATKMTLEEKSKIFLERIEERHVRYGLVSRSKLEIPGDLNSNVLIPSNNDGLWTGIYLAAESFRYAVTQSEEAKANAIRAFEAMEGLEKVTGIPGFPARSIIRPGDPEGKGDWRFSPDKKWKWIGDTSSDEMVGHFFAYPIFYELVADRKMKIRIEKLVTRILNHIIDHKYQMVDLNGEVTRWGVWNPDSLNHSVNWLYETGTNSLQILSFLGVGEYLVGDKKYQEAAKTLIKDHGYGENMILAKKYGPFDVNFVDNQLAFLPYYVMNRYGSQVVRPYFEESIRRTWQIARRDQTAMWNIITSASTGKDCDLQVALKDLQNIPVDMINWTMENSHRWDLLPDPLNDRMDRPQATRPIPVAERGITKWNLNPYQFDSSAGGLEENDGAYFLLAYWMGRFHRYW
jgi:hypothetical protein